MRFFWLIVGLMLGISIGRNKGDIPAPDFFAVVFAAVVLALLAWKAGNRDRRTAVAVAVAKAEASAEAKLEAVLTAQAHATGGSVQLVLADAAGNTYGSPVAVPDPAWLERLSQTRKDGHDLPRMAGQVDGITDVQRTTLLDSGHALDVAIEEPAGRHAS